MNRLLIMLLLTLAAFRSHAQLSFHNLGELLDFADKYGIVGKQSVLQYQISKKDETISRSALLPKVNIFGTADYYPLIPVLVVPEAVTGGSAPDKFQKVQLGLPWSFSAGAEVTMPVINLGKWETLKRYKLMSVQTDWNNKTNQETLHIQLTQSYYQALLAKAMLDLNHENEQISDELLRILEERKKNNVLDPADYNRSKNLQLDIRTAGIDYEKNYIQAIIALRQQLHLDGHTSMELLDSVESGSWMQLPEETALSGRPGWKAAEAGIAVADEQVKESKKAGLPAISFDGKYTYQTQIDKTISQHITYDFSDVGLRLDFPIFQGNYYKASRQKSEMQLELAKLSQQQTIDDLTRQQSEWRNNYQAALKKQPVLQQKLELTSDNLRIARLNMREGVMEFEEFNNIFQEYIKSRMDYLQNISDGIVSRLLLTLK